MASFTDDDDDDDDDDEDVYDNDNDDGDDDDDVYSLDRINVWLRNTALGKATAYKENKEFVLKTCGGCSA